MIRWSSFFIFIRFPDFFGIFWISFTFSDFINVDQISSICLLLKYNIIIIFSRYFFLISRFCSNHHIHWSNFFRDLTINLPHIINHLFLILFQISFKFSKCNTFLIFSKILLYSTSTEIWYSISQFTFSEICLILVFLLIFFKSSYFTSSDHIFIFFQFVLSLLCSRRRTYWYKSCLFKGLIALQYLSHLMLLIWCIYHQKALNIFPWSQEPLNICQICQKLLCHIQILD